MECERKNEGEGGRIGRIAGTRRCRCGFRANPEEARDERGRKIFETFSSNDLSFLVAEWSRWDKYKRAPWRQVSSASASDGW